MGSCCSKPADIADDRFEQPAIFEEIAEEDGIHLNKSTVCIENCCSKPTDYEHLRPNQKDKLNSFFEEIVTKLAVDFSNPDIQDIQSAVSEMLERIKTRINERGVFSISRLEPCGSMAEKTAMWKYRRRTGESFTEFDFLAVLQAACDFETRCPECCYVDTSPINLEKCEKYYDSLYRRIISLDRDRIADSFIRETNECLASCGCLEVECLYERDMIISNTFKRASTCSENQPGCDKCTIDTPTGTLRVKTSVEIGGIYGERCSLIFVWTSKAKTLSTRNDQYLPQTEKMDTLTIHIDFLPALEVFQSKQQSNDVSACSSGLVLNPTSSEYVHSCFLVPKHCVVCDKYGSKDTWRRSCCLTEIDTFVNKMSDKHRKCYKMIKYLLTGRFFFFINSYHIKIVLLHHSSSCSDAGEDFAKCVFKVLDELQHACKTEQLTSFHSQANLLERINSYDFNRNSENISTFKEAMYSAVSVSNSVSSFIVNITKLYYTILKDKRRSKNTKILPFGALHA